MNDPLLWSASILAGLAVTVAVWSGRTWLLARWERDIAWIRDTHARFHPEPVDARSYLLAYYAGFLLLLLVLLALLPSALLAVIVWMASWLLPRRVVAWAWKRRLARIDVQIPQCVSSLANSLRAGLTLVQSIGRLAEQAPEPIRGEFRIMANQYAYGADMETVIINAKRRLNLPNFSLFASALLLNREMGGDISETLTRISNSLDKLREMRKTVEAHTSEGRTNIKVLLVAPIFMLAVMSMVMPRGVKLLFTTMPGWAVLTIAGALAGTGVYVAHRITRSEV